MLITLLTDFGYKDPFVGIMKGTILNINPSALIVDITHGIPPHNVMEAALALEESYGYFPQKSIHVVVVDPEVGSGRRPILVQADDCYFIGPDNGVFTPVFDAGAETLDVIHLTAEHYFLPKKGNTFHGRDVFAPVAAWLSRGISVENMGERITDYMTIKIPKAQSKDDRVEGEVISIDRFGNAITNIRQLEIDGLYIINPMGGIEITAAGATAALRNHYSEAKENVLSGVINSSGRLELFLYKGNASAAFNMKAGDPVAVRLAV
ncbi:MAG: SAM-dependent chlorinase/fluorinase [Thermodesulfovibrionales bacterium]|nr:SAM-dependent chlorinase/fluorinase [Thermodesulfovibrionales bacterium]